MTYRVLALTVAAGLISSAALAKPHCPLGKIYYRSKHGVAKEVAIERGIYHYRHHIAAEATGTTIVRRSAKVRLAAPAAAIPVPPVRLVRIGTASPPTRNENDNSIGPIVEFRGKTLAPLPRQRQLAASHRSRSRCIMQRKPRRGRIFLTFRLAITPNPKVKYQN
jgi:hypothetical protein